MINLPWNSLPKMQHQEQLKKHVSVLQQRVVDAETKLLVETERNIEEWDDSIADLRKRIWPSTRGVSSATVCGRGNVVK